MLAEALTPLGNARRTSAQLLGDLPVGFSLVGEQNDPGALNQAMLPFAAAAPFGKRLYLVIHEADLGDWLAHTRQRI
jgi:hypothetical protein